MIEEIEQHREQEGDSLEFRIALTISIALMILGLIFGILGSRNSWQQRQQPLKSIDRAQKATGSNPVAPTISTNVDFIGNSTENTVNMD